MTRALRIAIVGYGIAGISAAIFLRRLGHDIVHFERSSTLGSGGGGLLLNGAGLATLNEMGLLSAVMSRGAVVSRIRGETVSGRPVMDLRYADHRADCHAVGIQRGALFDVLSEADRHATAVTTSTQIAVECPVRGYLSDQNHARIGPFDLIVAADGVKSNVRAGLGGLVHHDRPFPWAALVCLLDDPNDVAGDGLFQSFSGTRHASIWPVGARRPDAPRRISVSINTFLDESPNVCAWKRQLSRLCPRIVPLLDQTVHEGDLLPFTYRDVVLRRYHVGRVVLIGDAAHSMSPQLGQGASAGLLDAWVFANALEHNNEVPSALVEFDRKRRARIARVQRVSRWMTPFFQSDSRMLAMLRDRAFYPLSRVPVIHRAMLRTLDGQQRRPHGPSISSPWPAQSTTSNTVRSFP